MENAGEEVTLLVNRENEKAFSAATLKALWHKHPVCSGELHGQCAVTILTPPARNINLKHLS
jgi:hypothetical protein